MWWLVDRWLIDPKIVPALNRWRRELGLQPVSRVFKGWLHSPRRVIGLFPEWFAPIQPDWPPQLRLTGFPLYDEPDEHPLSAGLQTFLDAGSPPIRFTPWSANRVASQFFAAALEATRRLGRRALSLTRYPEQLPAVLGADSRHEPYVPFTCSAALRRDRAPRRHRNVCAGARRRSAAIDDAARVRSARQHDAGVAARGGALGAPARVPRRASRCGAGSLLDDSRVAERCGHGRRKYVAAIRSQRRVQCRRR
jgi:rhamnosyltransferase subunit B